MSPVQFGTSWESFSIAPAAGMRALADIGFRSIRLWIFGNSLNPSPGVWDWTKVDADIAAIRGAGMEVHVSLLWVPVHGTIEKLPTFLPYTGGCSERDDPNDPEGAKGLHLKQVDYCLNPARIDPEWSFMVGAELAKRHGANIARYGAGNEPQGEIYNPAVRLGWDIGMERHLRDLVIPFTMGVRSVVSDAKFIGLEADHERVVSSLLQLEHDLGLHLFDDIGSHPYSWTNEFPGDSYARAGLFVAAAAPYLNGRSERFSECGDRGKNPGYVVEWTREIIRRFPDIAGISWHDCEQWFLPGTWDAGTYVPNEINYAMRALVREINGETEPAPPPPPPPRKLTEPAYRIVNMKRFKTRDRVFISSVYLFAAVRVPTLIVSRHESLAVSMPIWQDDYMIVPIANDLMHRAGDQMFTVHLHEGNGPPYFGPKWWSELPEASKVEFGFDDDSGTRRRGVRS